ncbi:hypothetical protein ACPPVO_11250 [Dactylosporangium sp. McL0621]|uniref:hypothetical protein n=1 Tax=Dactylosporangium sp. McL0621 TaxID=3415678 RepID=UPI003CF26C84
MSQGLRRLGHRHADHEVMDADDQDAQKERKPVLVQADQPQHHKEVKVQVGEPVPGVHERHGRQQQPDRHGPGATPPRPRNTGNQRTQNSTRNETPDQPSRTVRMFPHDRMSVYDREHHEHRRVQPKHHGQRPVPGPERRVAEPDLRHEPGDRSGHGVGSLRTGGVCPLHRHVGGHL